MSCFVPQSPVPNPQSPSQPPSRRDNPFATCWTRPGALPFRFADGQSAELLVAKLADQGWWGAIVGPHGSGKSSLLESLKPAIEEAERRVIAIALRDGQRRLPPYFFEACEGSRSLAVIDGYEQLGRWERLKLAPVAAARRSACSSQHTPQRMFQHSFVSHPIVRSSRDLSPIWRGGVHTNHAQRRGR